MKYIYSDNEGRMVPKSVTYLGKCYIWNESDEMYYREDTDEDALTLEFVESRLT